MDRGGGSGGQNVEPGERRQGTGKKIKNFFLSFSLSCSLLQMAGSTEKKMMKKIGKKQAKERE
jgi:hypothetical protein